MNGTRSPYSWNFLSDLTNIKLNYEDSKGDSTPEKPLAVSVRVSKNTVIYNAHSYHTKVPPEGIVPFLEYYSKPGDIILDPFCGSGMTGVAELILAKKTRSHRRVVLNDLGPAAVHISYNHNTDCDPKALRAAYDELIKKVGNKVRSLYMTWEPSIQSDEVTDLLARMGLSEINSLPERKDLAGDPIKLLKVGKRQIELFPAYVISTIWSEQYWCPQEKKGKRCGAEIRLWDHGFDQKKGVTKKVIICPKCGQKFKRGDFGREISSVPVFVELEYYNQFSGKKERRKRSTFAFEREQQLAMRRSSIRTWYPTDRIAPFREMMTMGPAKLGIRTIADFYTVRNLKACSLIWDAIHQIRDERLKKVLAFAATNTFWHATKMRRFNARGGSRPLTGTLYVPQISVECNVLEVLTKKVGMLGKYYQFIKRDSEREILISNNSATQLNLPTNSIDYIFTDPPFGGNIFYSDCSIIWEGWLGKFTDEKHEIHFNRVRKPENGGKTFEDYKMLMYESFAEMYRVLKPGKWASIVFNNSEDRVLELFRDAALAAGFEISEVAFFDKTQKSFKGYLGRDGKQKVTNCDIVLTVRKLSRVNKVKNRTTRKEISDYWMERQIESYLRALPKLQKRNPNLYTEEHRTTPFIHTALMRKIISEDQSFTGFSIDRIIAILTRSFVEVSGRWYTREQAESKRNQLELDVA